ncbi:MAG: hypothetical protein R3B38_00535 [Patescibacteria group bacterium]
MELKHLYASIRVDPQITNLIIRALTECGLPQPNSRLHLTVITPGKIPWDIVNLSSLTQALDMCKQPTTSLMVKLSGLQILEVPRNCNPPDHKRYAIVAQVKREDWLSNLYTHLYSNLVELGFEASPNSVTGLPLPHISVGFAPNREQAVEIREDLIQYGEFWYQSFTPEYLDILMRSSPGDNWTKIFALALRG